MHWPSAHVGFKSRRFRLPLFHFRRFSSWQEKTERSSLLIAEVLLFCPQNNVVTWRTSEVILFIDLFIKVDIYAVAKHKLLWKAAVVGAKWLNFSSSSASLFTTALKHSWIFLFFFLAVHVGREYRYGSSQLDQMKEIPPPQSLTKCVHMCQYSKEAETLGFHARFLMYKSQSSILLKWCYSAGTADKETAPGISFWGYFKPRPLTSLHQVNVFSYSSCECAAVCTIWSECVSERVRLWVFLMSVFTHFHCVTTLLLLFLSSLLFDCHEISDINVSQQFLHGFRINILYRKLFFFHFYYWLLSFSVHFNATTSGKCVFCCWLKLEYWIFLSIFICVASGLKLVRKQN